MPELLGSEPPPEPVARHPLHLGHVVPVLGRAAPVVFAKKVS